MLVFGTIIHGDPEVGTFTIRPARGGPNVIVRVPASHSLAVGDVVTYRVQSTGHNRIIIIETRHGTTSP
ncbi:hypothetical protein FQ377_13680 [Arthrobacter echini]|uniref:Uncharacterized protein n=1 Tax=Arthrobacter echini TaxID=1529066 RepID=A0A5D0XJJ8_9MICC|nr:hypothetical protein [Arthrobacter echini]TYC96633.1 hypothetical protein FQ377_13680 [Arthrobacter echini]